MNQLLINIYFIKYDIDFNHNRFFRTSDFKGKLWIDK